MRTVGSAEACRGRGLFHVTLAHSVEVESPTIVLIVEHRLFSSKGLVAEATCALLLCSLTPIPYEVERFQYHSQERTLP